VHDLTSLRDALRRFAADRDWDQFHSPKNLATAVSVEAAELLEPFQWLTEAQSRNLSAEQTDAVREEISDVLIYLVRLADKLDIDLLAAAELKVAKNAEKYPAERVRGSARKFRQDAT
jgi:NTP pyrophosphatase (non-canonical NTP hydrolase)